MQAVRALPQRRPSCASTAFPMWSCCSAAFRHGSRPVFPSRNRRPMAKVVMYSTGVCPYCRMAERLLESKGVTDIEKIRVDMLPERRQEMMKKTGRRTVPQIYIGLTHVGGFDDLAALDAAGGLEPLLKG